MGRTFLPEEDQPGTGHVVIVSYGLWQGRFGGDPNILGRKLTIGGDPYTVIGVMPASFSISVDGYRKHMGAFGAHR